LTKPQVQTREDSSKGKFYGSSEAKKLSSTSRIERTAPIAPHEVKSLVWVGQVKEDHSWLFEYAIIGK